MNFHNLRNWRRPAVYKKTEWPRWGARVLLNISGSVDTNNRVVALGVVINAVGAQIASAATGSAVAVRKAASCATIRASASAGRVATACCGGE